MLQEVFQYGERVRTWEIQVQTQGSSTWTAFANGTVIGYKQIILGNAHVITAARLNIIGSVASPLIATFAAFTTCST